MTILYSKRQQSSIDKVVDFAKNIENNGFQYKIAAGIVYKNKIITIANNVNKTHTFQKNFSKNDQAIFLHAETAAIHKALKVLGKEKLKQATLIVARIANIQTNPKQMHYSQQIANSKPCSGCEHCINSFGIKNVIYSMNDGFKMLEF